MYRNLAIFNAFFCKACYEVCEMMQIICILFKYFRKIAFCMFFSSFQTLHGMTFGHVRTLPTQPTASYGFLHFPPLRSDIAVIHYDMMRCCSYIYIYMWRFLCGAVSQHPNFLAAMLQMLKKIVKQFKNRLLYDNVDTVWYVEYSFVQLCRLRTSFGGSLTKMEHGFFSYSMSVFLNWMRFINYMSCLSSEFKLHYFLIFLYNIYLQQIVSDVSKFSSFMCIPFTFCTWF